MQGTPTIRFASPGDTEAIHGLVRELAEFEKLSHTVVATADDLHRALFGESSALEALVVDAPPNAAPALAGTALFYPTYSTFAGRPGLWLEDLYVRPAFRRQGLGRALLERFLALARERDCARAEWSVLDWNTEAIRFYQSLGAELLPAWRIARLTLRAGQIEPAKGQRSSEHAPNEQGNSSSNRNQIR